MMDVDGNCKNSPNNLVETVENSTKVAHDPGWNDPPMLSYGAQGPAKFVKKGLLNKRVAFPLSSGPPTAPSTSTLSGVPPKGSTAADQSVTPQHNLFTVPLGLSLNDNSSLKYSAPEPLLGSSQPAKESVIDGVAAYKAMSLEKVINIFEKIISKLVTPEHFERDEVEIRKRLEVMKKMWSEDKLNGAVQQKMIQLAEALEVGRGSVANDLHIELVVDHTSQVSTWMPGVRKLVHCCMLAADRAQKVDDAGDASSEVDLITNDLPTDTPEEDQLDSQPATVGKVDE